MPVEVNGQPLAQELGAQAVVEAVEVRLRHRSEAIHQVPRYLLDQVPNARLGVLGELIQSLVTFFPAGAR